MTLHGGSHCLSSLKCIISPNQVYFIWINLNRQCSSTIQAKDAGGCSGSNVMVEITPYFGLKQCTPIMFPIWYLSGRTQDSSLGLNQFDARAFSFSPKHPSSLRCINEYLAIDGGGNM